MMKFNYIYLLIAGLLFTTSCEKFLDIIPDGQEKKDHLLGTTTGVEDALYGVYAQLRQTDLYGELCSFYTLDVLAQYFDCYGDDVVTPTLKYDYENSDVESEFERIWIAMYNNISNANAVITCELLQTHSGYPYDIYKGEALGLRAFMHFDLLRLYTDDIVRHPDAGGIPYSTEFSLTPPPILKAQDVYRRIIDDLRQAESLLEDEDQYVGSSNFMTERKIHFNYYAAQALLARVYLTMGITDSARYYADKVIQSGKFRISERGEIRADDFRGQLSNNETIFGVYSTGFYSTVYYYLQQKNSMASLDPRDDILDYFVTDDARRDAYFDNISEEDRNSIRFSKLTDKYESVQTLVRPDNIVPGINLIRLPEMYYIAAETRLDTDPEEATRLLNEVVSRRIEGSEVEASLETIDEERYKEFMGEGQTFFNMKRRNLPIAATDGTTIAPSEAIFTIPIPESEYNNR